MNLFIPKRKCNVAKTGKNLSAYERIDKGKAYDKRTL